jgi:hypothetical protein
MKLMGTFLFVILVTIVSKADVLVSPSNINFGSVFRGSFPVSRDVQVSNQGSEAVEIKVGYDCGWDYSLDNYCDQTLEANESCRLEIQFGPTVEGYQPCNAYVLENGRTHWIQLTGNGI